MAKKDKMVSEPLLISGELNLGPSKAEIRRGAVIALMIVGPNNGKLTERLNGPRLNIVLVRKGRYSISNSGQSIPDRMQECTKQEGKRTSYSLLIWILCPANVAFLVYILKR